ncbi:hypothetical protein L0Y65_04675 [Candidatus Micrarchaeota archaeon]|nr:hypothetical protein [Candidatus Micrarchaeota archaeon]
MRFMLVLALLALAQMEFAGFPRPWENETWVSTNPNIWTFGESFWWNLPEFQKTLDGAGMDGVLRLDSDPAVKDNIESAVDSAEEARRDLMVCTAAVIASLGIMPASPSMALIAVLSDSSGCIAYHENWIASVDSTLLAAEYSTDYAERAVSDARREFDRMRFAGLCDEDYSGPGSGSCAELDGAFRTVDKNISEGDYGKYVVMAQHSDALRRALADPAPDISYAASITGLAWGEDGIVPSFRRAQNLSLSALAEAETGYQQGLKSIQARKQLAEKSFRELESEGAGIIARAPSGFTSRASGSVKERFASLADERRRLEVSLADSAILHARTGDRGYLAGAISGIEAADGGYASLLQELEALRRDAESAVEGQKDEAEMELARAEKCMASAEAGPESASLYDEAAAAFESGEGAGTLGGRFEKYYDAAALARSACGSRSYGEALEDRASVEYLRALIGLAEKDQINVASEKESLKLIPLLPESMQGEAARESQNSIYAKARLKYEDDLLAVRSRICGKLSQAGPEAADLFTDLKKCEEGLISDDGLALPEALGRLKKLDSDYRDLEEAVDGYMGRIIGNAMSIRANPLITSVRLDSPADITLDAVMANPRPYNATHVDAVIRMESPGQFVYGDIVEGSGGVESVRSTDGGKSIVLVFASVGAFETKRVVFNKQSVLAHTLSSSSSAEGIGNGKARVAGRMEIELDCGISSLELPRGFENGLIDGMAGSRPLESGKHTLAYDAVLEDAYNETLLNIKAYRIGTNSKVEYDVRITPLMDLERVPVFLNSVNDSRITSFSAVCATGEAVRDKARISDTQYSVSVSGLKKGRESVLKVSYNVEDAESYVRERLSSLDGLDLGPSANALLAQARLQAAAGNHSEALAFIEKAVSASQQEEKEESKHKESIDSLEKGIREELGMIESALNSSNSSSPFVQKLATRRDELRRVLAESGSMNNSQKAEALGKTDSNWLGKELTAFKKEAYAAYNDLKERFYAAGNTTTPSGFLLFEDAFRKLESGGRLEYAMDALSALDGVRDIVTLQESSSQSQKAGQKALVDDAKRGAQETLERYLRQSAAAKGTDYSSFFTETEKKVETLIEDAEEAADGEPRIFRQRLDALIKSRGRMEQTLSSLKNESEARLSMLESIIEGKELAPERRAALGARVDSMRNMLSSGDYVNALRAGSAISKELDSEEEPNGNGVLVLGVTALAILAAVGVYVSRQPKQKKELRKLTSFSVQAPPQRRHPQAGPEAQGRSTRSSPSPDRYRSPPPGGSIPQGPGA